MELLLILTFVAGSLAVGGIIHLVYLRAKAREGGVPGRNKLVSEGAQ